MKFSKDGKICAIDDHIPTKEELDESLKDVPPEVLAQLRKKYTEIAKKLGIQLNFDNSEEYL